MCILQTLIYLHLQFNLYRISYRKDSTISHSLWYVIIFDKSYMTSTLVIVTTQLPGNNGYCGGKVVFIDTEVRFAILF